MPIDLGAETDMGSVSKPARVAAPGKPISADQGRARSGWAPVVEVEVDGRRWTPAELEPVEQPWNRGGFQHLTVVVPG